MRTITPCLAIAVIVMLSAGIARADDRLVYSENSPDWLTAIGRLQVPGSRYTEGRREHFTEDCSATLIARPGRSRANTILTAWHCLEKYVDLSKPIRFSLYPENGNPLELEAFVISSGGSISADWALLRLHQAVTADVVGALAVDTATLDEERDIVMAGYSRDAVIGAGGSHLTYDPACRVTAGDMPSNSTDCFAHRGASGGPVIQKNRDGEPAVYGVISEGNGEGLSTFVPTSTFRGALHQHL